jgi:hypothetical protein
MARSTDLLKVAALLPEDDLLPHHQAKIDTMFQKKQRGYRRTAYNLAHRSTGIPHMWTAPSLQDVLQCFDQIACVHMSGLFVRSHMNAGQDGFRNESSKTDERPRRGPLGNAEFLSSWID